MDWLWLLLTGFLSAIILGIPAGFFIGIKYRKKIAEMEIGSAEEEALKIVGDALKAAENKKKEALIEAKDEIHKLRLDTDRELKERRNEINRQERRTLQKEETLDKKIDGIEKREEALQEKIKQSEKTIQDKLDKATQQMSEIEELRKREFEMLERISGFTEEQAKAYVIKNLENQLAHEKAIKINNYEQQLKLECDQKAREYISNAICRLAAEQVSESTVSVVTLPNDEMKGRIIGREGRNIRAIETLTGVDLIIDDTPEAITLSCHDPIRREVARQTLEKLVSDGRIHPTRIEEMVEKGRRDVEAKIRQNGERAVMEVGLHGIHPELVNLLGRLSFRTSFCQNVLNHSLEVAYISGMLAGELGTDVTAAKRAGLLHDIGKAVSHEVEGSHITIGTELARKYKENEHIIHAIAAHHGDIEAKTVVACIVQAADAISAARPGARRENIDNFIKRLERLEEIATSFEGVEKSFAIQAGREIRIIVKPENINDDQMVVLAREIAGKIESNLDYPGQIKVHMVRESRAIEYAK